MTRRPFFSSLEDGLDRLIVRCEPFRRLDADALNQVTRAHEWSLGQLFDHLVKSDVAVGKLLLSGLAEAPPASTEEVKHSLMGRFLLNSMSKPNIPVPKPFLPDAGGPASIEAYVNHLASMRKALSDLSMRDLSQIKISSPGAKFIRYHGYDALAIGVAHGERHLTQAEAIARLLS